MFPELSDRFLTPDIPHCECETFDWLYCLHVETNGGDSCHRFVEFDLVQYGCFACKIRQCFVLRDNFKFHCQQYFSLDWWDFSPNDGWYITLKSWRWYEPRHVKTNVLYMRKQRRRSASRLSRSWSAPFLRYIDSKILLLSKSEISSL